MNVTRHRDVDRGPLAKVVFPRVLDCEVTFYSPFPYCAVWQEVVRVSPTSGRRELCPPFLEGRVSINYLEFFFTSDLCRLLHLFVCPAVY